MLSTYNGEKYLVEQLNSLLTQNGVELTILIRDDGSIDGTLGILREYSANNSNIILEEGENIGCALSFFALMNKAVDDFSNYDYYAFCDQDDVWKEEKLSIAVSKLNQENTNPYKLYFSCADYVNADLSLIKKSHIPVEKLDFNTSLIRSYSLGCTMVLNIELLKEALKINEYIESEDFNINYLPLHDAWINAIAFAIDATIYADNYSYILYRQHENNVTGSKNVVQRYVKAFKRRVRKNGQRTFMNTLKYKFFGIKMAQENKFYLQKVISYKESIIKTVSLALDIDLKTESFLDKLLWRLTIITRLY